MKPQNLIAKYINFRVCVRARGVSSVLISAFRSKVTSQERAEKRRYFGHT